MYSLSLSLSLQSLSLTSFLAVEIKQQQQSCHIFTLFKVIVYRSYNFTFIDFLSMQNEF